MKKFIIHSYVDINWQIDSVLFVNTDTKEMLITKNIFVIKSIMLFLDSKTPDMIIELDKESCSDEEAILFFKKLEDSVFGEFVELDKDKYPVQIASSVKINTIDYRIYNDITKEKDQFDNYNTSSYHEIIGCNILSNLKEVTIYCNSDSNAKYEYAYKQYLYPPIFESETLDFSNVYNFIGCNVFLNRVNIVIGDITEYLKLEINHLINFFVNKSLLINVYMRYNTFLCMDFDFPDCVSLKFWVDDCFDDIQISPDLEYFFLVSSNKELGVLEKKYYQNIEFEIYPYFNKNNIEFCYNNFSYDMTDIQKSNITERKIWINSVVNDNLFGSISIFTNGDIYTSLNSEPIGNIVCDKLKKVLLKARKIDSVWMLIRKRIKSCEKCIFNTLCPPVTEFELFCKKNAFCKIDY